MSRHELSTATAAIGTGDRPATPVARPGSLLVWPMWRSRLAALVIAGVLVIGTAVVRFVWFTKSIPPIGFGVPVVLIALFRRRRLLWAATAVFVFASILKFTALAPADGETNEEKTRDCCLLDFDLLLMALVSDRWIVAQDASEKHARELESANQELEQRRRQAEESSIRKTHFLAAVSHDIRTPANALNLLSELIARTWNDPAQTTEIPDLVRELRESSSALVELLNDVLDVARYDSGKIEMQLGEFDVRELADEQVRNMSRLAEEKQLSLESVSDGGEPVRITSDRLKLARVLGNLIGNAIKFTDHGGVTVRAADGGDSVSIRVSDTGVGIAPQMQSHIFEEFVQLRNPERDHSKGTGLGLSICRRLVLAMGGDLSVASTPGKGSTFTVTLPKRPPVPPVPPAPPVPEASVPNPGPAC